MDELLDPGVAFILAVIGAAVLALGGAYLLGDTVTLEMAFAVMMLFGFLAGHFASSTRSEAVGVFLFSAAMAYLLADALPLGWKLNMAFYVVGFFLGIVTERRL